MKWSICILTMPERRKYLLRILSNLREQTEKLNDVDVFFCHPDPALSLGANRQRMIDLCENSSYVNFVDDDDLVSDDYVSSIYPLLDGVDYVGFQVQGYIDGVPQKPTYHTLHCGNWHEDEKGYYRDLSHLNPIRRELALLVPFEGGVGEDHRWADRLRETNAVQTEHYIDRVMYHYYFRTRKND